MPFALRMTKDNPTPYPCLVFADKRASNGYTVDSCTSAKIRCLVSGDKRVSLPCWTHVRLHSLPPIRFLPVRVPWLLAIDVHEQVSPLLFALCSQSASFRVEIEKRIFAQGQESCVSKLARLLAKTKGKKEWVRKEYTKLWSSVISCIVLHK